LPRSALLKLYARSPGRSQAQAARSWLADAALIDVIIWTQGRAYTAATPSKIGALHMTDETTTTTTTVIKPEPIPEPKPEPQPEPDTTTVETDGPSTTTVERP
jgi:hypothetical protein